MLEFGDVLRPYGDQIQTMFTEHAGWPAEWSESDGVLTLARRDHRELCLRVDQVDPATPLGWKPVTDLPPLSAPWATRTERDHYLVRLEEERDRILAGAPARSAPLLGASFAHTSALLHEDDAAAGMAREWDRSLTDLRSSFPNLSLWYVRPPAALLSAMVGVRFLAAIRNDPQSVAHTVQTKESALLRGSGILNGGGASFRAQIAPVGLLWAPAALGFTFEATPGVLVLDLASLDVDLRQRDGRDLAQIAIPGVETGIEAGVLAPAQELKVSDFSVLLRWWAGCLSAWYARTLGEMPSQIAISDAAEPYLWTALLHQIVDDLNHLSTRGYVSGASLEPVAYAMLDKLAAASGEKEAAFVREVFDRRGSVFIRLRAGFNSIPDPNVRHRLKTWLERAIDGVQAELPESVRDQAGEYIRERRNLHHGAPNGRLYDARLRFLFAGDPNPRFAARLAEMARALAFAVVAIGPPKLD